MYTLDITFQEWELVYNARVGNRRPEWAKALIDAPLWPGADGIFELPLEVAMPLDEGLRGDSVGDTPTLPGLDTNTMLFFKLQQFCTDFTLDMVEENG